MTRRDIAIVKAYLWDSDGEPCKSWVQAQEKLRSLGEQGYQIVTVTAIPNAEERGDIVWTLERLEQGGLR